jgi:PAS domain S-box-containing protein
VYANEGFERLTGYDIKDVLGRNCRFLQGADTDPRTIEEIRRSIRDKKACTVEILNYRKDGTIFWNRLSITPVKDETGRVTNFIGIQSDITKRKKAEEALFRVSKKLEAANQRMKGDLNDARELQLAMLPAHVPKVPYVDIATTMKTAQEVGGDYYDFHVDQDSNLTIALGDATGHGLKAGTIVTATKILFNSLVHHADPKYILKQTSSALKEMGFRGMYMAMLIAKVTAGKLRISSAGMPYSYIYRKADHEVSEIPLKGVPLGSFPDFPYQLAEVDLSKGDTILFLSDGLSEHYNDKGEFFGDDRIRSLFHKVAEKTPAYIIDQLTKAANQWTDTTIMRDDMTLMVMKAK